MNDDRNEVIFKELGNSKEDRENLHKRCDAHEDRMTGMMDNLQEQIDTNFSRLWNFTEEVEKNTSVNFD